MGPHPHPPPRFIFTTFMTELVLQFDRKWLHNRQLKTSNKPGRRQSSFWESFLSSLLQAWQEPSSFCLAGLTAHSHPRREDRQKLGRVPGFWSLAGPQALMAQQIKNRPAMQETQEMQVGSLGW